MFTNINSMTTPAMQGQSRQHGEHLILYDGVCGLCNRLNRFVLSHDKSAFFDFAALQSLVGRAVLRHFGKEPDDLNTFYLVSDYRGVSPKLLSKSHATLAVLEPLDPPWRWLAVLKVFPKVLLDSCYDLIARHRYGLFGQAGSCALPSSEYRHRFIDHGSQSEELLKFFSGEVLRSGNERDSRT